MRLSQLTISSAPALSISRHGSCQGLRRASQHEHVCDFEFARKMLSRPMVSRSTTAQHMASENANIPKYSIKSLRLYGDSLQCGEYLNVFDRKCYPIHIIAVQVLW